MTDPDSFFPQVRDRFAGEYWRVARADSKALITQNVGRGFDAPAGSWIAFSPGIARDLGWRPAGDGLFRWNDANGAVMVESRWWNDGIFELQPYDRDEVGEGWLVVATNEAVRLILEYLDSSMARTIEIERHSDAGEGRASLVEEM